MAHNILETTQIRDLVATKGKVVSVSDTASVQDVLCTLLANNVTAVPVAGSADSALDANGNSLKDGRVRYIGFVSVLDVVLHIADNMGQPEKELGILAVNIMGQSNESRTLWTLSPNEKLLQVLEAVCSGGVHRFLVSSEDAAEQGSHWGLLTQTDIIRFLLQHVDQLGPVASKPVAAIGCLKPGLSPMTAPSNMPLVDVLRLMRREGGLTAMAVVEYMNGILPGSNPRPLQGGKIVGTISATDFRGLTPETLRPLTDMTVEEFLRSMPGSNGGTRPPVTCRPCTPLAEVMATAISSKVHRVWVTNEDGWLSGVVTFSDILNAIRQDNKISVANC